MEFLSVLSNPEEEVSEQNVVKKSKKKKKGTSAAVRKAQAKAAEDARQNLIKQRQLFLAETKKRVTSEWERNHAKAQVLESEFQQRKELLLESYKRLAEIEEAWQEYQVERRKTQEWNQYLNCGRLPDPSSVPQLNSYIFVWTEIDKDVQIPHCIEKTEEVIKLLSRLEEVIKDPGPDRPARFVKDLKEDHIDRGTFQLLSRIATDMVPLNVTTSKFFAKCPHFLLSVWTELITPIPSSWGKEIRQPLKVFFEEIATTVIIPVSMLDIRKVLRVMWLNYDHWSDKCRTFDCPPLPSYFEENLYTLFLAEHENKVEIMNTREQLEAATKKKLAAIPPEPTLSQEIFAWDSVPQSTLSNEIIFKEFEIEDNLGRRLKENLNEFEVNLRERTFLGALLLLEIFHQPPQAKHLRYKHSVILRKKPPILHPANYYVKYPPKDDNTQDGQETSAEERKFGGRWKTQDAEEEKNKLLVVEFKINESVIWFETPQLANWDPENGYWSTEDVHMTVFDDIDRTIRFRTGRLGLMGLHVKRYCNLPYQDWMFEANKSEGINFYLKTAQADLFFRIKPGKVCLENLENVPSKALNWILGNYYSPVKLLEYLRKGGIDVFPAPDASTYVEEVKTKHVIIERNIYQVWGLFSKTFRFKRSKFNQAAGRPNIVFQAQETYENHQVDFCLIQTTMCSSYVLDITEDSDSYSSARAPTMEPCIDFYSLLYNHSTGFARRQADATCYLLIETVREFLSYVRPISFS